MAENESRRLLWRIRTLRQRSCTAEEVADKVERRLKIVPEGVRARSYQGGRDLIVPRHFEACPVRNP